MSNTKPIFKYLDAGAKSSPVVMDPGLPTGNDQTIYLYHHQRDQIIEYRRDIVEAKLRDLSAAEAKTTKELQQAYEKARASFNPRGAAAMAIPEKSAQPAKAAPSRNSDETDGEGEGDDIDFVDDADMLDEDEEDEEEGD